MARNDHSGYPLKWFKDQNAAKHAYECAVCLEVLKDPVQVRDCGHQFCALCIDDILKADPHCPTCRIEISDATVFEDHAARRLIKQLEVNCCNEKCIWHGPLGSLVQDHHKKCNFSIQNVYELKLEKLGQEFKAFTLNVLTWNKKYEKDIKDLNSKHEQDINEINLKHAKDVKELKLKNEEDIKDLKLKCEQEIKGIQLKHEKNIKELELKLQQSENRLQRLEEKGKESSEPVLERSMEPVEIVPEQNEERGGPDLLPSYGKSQGITEPVEINAEQGENATLEKDFSQEEKKGSIDDRIQVKKGNEQELAGSVKQARRKYDRDFLLQFQFMPVCTEKPACLPDHEIVLDSPVFASKAGGSQRGGSDFLPSHARQKNPGDGSKRNSRKMKRQLRKAITVASPPSVVESKDRCLQPEQKEKELSEENTKTIRANNDNETLGPGARFSNSAALSDSSQEQNQPQRNACSALIGGRGMSSSQSSNPRKLLSAASSGFSSDGSSDESEINRDKAHAGALKSVGIHCQSQNDKQQGFPIQAIVMPGQRPPYIPGGHSMPIGERQMRNRPMMYSSSSQGQSPLQGFNSQQGVQYQVSRQEPLYYSGQPVMRPAYIPNVPQYQMPATRAPIQSTYHAVQQNQPMQLQKKPKRSSQIVIRDPSKDNKDVTEEFLHGSTANGRSSTPPLTNSTVQTDSSKIQAQFAAQVAARVGGEKGKQNFGELYTMQLFKADPFNREVVICFIEKHFREDKRKEPQFIRQLVTAVAESCIVNKGRMTGPVCCENKLVARKDILRKYLLNDVILEVEALFALQEIYVKYNEPSGMLSQFFHTLYEELVITKEAFMTWIGVENPCLRGKESALQETAVFFNWLLD